METCSFIPAVLIIILFHSIRADVKSSRPREAEQEEEIQHEKNNDIDNQIEVNLINSFETNFFDNPTTQFRYVDGSESTNKHMPLILWWTPNLFPRLTSDELPFVINCGGINCFSSKNRTLLQDPRTRGVLFYGTDLDPFDLPLPRHTRHEWALLHEESPLNNFMLSHFTFIKLFNHTATFRRESDYPLTLQYVYSLEYLINRKSVPLNTKNELRGSPSSYAPVMYVQSHCGVASDRDRYVTELMKYITVDSYGSCLHNRDLPKGMTNPAESFEKEDFLKFIAYYKFHIAFENALCKDYMTEKLFRCLHVGSVPIYMGSPAAQDWMPNNKSIIMAQDFDSPKELAEYIDFLDKNDDKYLEYLSFKEPSGVTNKALLKSLREREWRMNDEDFSDFIIGFECHVCKKLNERMSIEKAHKHNQSIPLLPPKLANNTHLGCPQPYTSIGEPENVPSDDRWQIMDWIGQYWGDLDKAYGVRNMLQAKETDPTTFHKYWTDFTKKMDRQNN